jgi:hypothetical protein
VAATRINSTEFEHFIFEYGVSNQGAKRVARTKEIFIAVERMAHEVLPI